MVTQARPTVEVDEGLGVGEAWAAVILFPTGIQVTVRENTVDPTQVVVEVIKRGPGEEKGAPPWFYAATDIFGDTDGFRGSNTFEVSVSIDPEER